MKRHHNESEQQAAIMIGLWTKYKQEEGLDEGKADKKDLLTQALTAVALETNTPTPQELHQQRQLPRPILPSTVNLSKDLPHIDMEIEVAKKHEERQPLVQRSVDRNMNDREEVTQTFVPVELAAAVGIEPARLSVSSKEIVMPRLAVPEPPKVDPYRVFDVAQLDTPIGLLTRAYDIARSPISTRSDSYKIFDYSPSVVAMQHLPISGVPQGSVLSNPAVRMSANITSTESQVTVIVSSQNLSSPVNEQSNIYSTGREQSRTQLASTSLPPAYVNAARVPFALPFPSTGLSGSHINHIQSLISPFSQERMMHLNPSQPNLSTTTTQWTQL